MIHADILESIARHIKELDKYGFIPENWEWDKKKIENLENIDLQLINDIVELHKKYTSELPAKIYASITKLYTCLERLKKDPKYNRSEIIGLVAQIKTIYDEYEANIDNYIKSKVVDITKPGTLIHLFDIKELESIWKKGIKYGSAIMLGPVIGHPPVEGVHNITLDYIIHAHNAIFGFGHGFMFDHHETRESEGWNNIKTAENILKEFTKEDLDKLYINIKQKRRTVPNHGKRPSIKQVAMLKLLVKKYEKFALEQKIEDINDRKIIQMLKEMYKYTSGFSDKTWSVGLIVNRKFCSPATSSFDCANESHIEQAAPRELILGLYLKSSKLFEAVKHRMFKLTMDNPKDRVPIYNPHGELVYPSDRKDIIDSAVVRP